MINPTVCIEHNAQKTIFCIDPECKAKDRFCCANCVTDGEHLDHKARDYKKVYEVIKNPIKKYKE